VPYLAANVSVMDYGADPTGTSDSTSAFNQALAAVNAAGGGVVSVPEGTFRITPSGSPAVGISFMGTGSAGYQGVRLVGAGANATTLVKQANGTLLQVSGPSTSPGTGTTHTRYCSVESIGFNGNGLTGIIFQCYYVDNLLVRDVNVANNADVVLDSAEFWDSRFYNLLVGGCGSAASNAATPNMLLRNSAAASGFGNSTDSVNNIYFQGCHWEAFHTGAMWVQQGLGNSAGPYAIFLTDSKMETSVVNGGPHLSVDTNSREVDVKHLYAYSGGFTAGYSTPQDVITYSAQWGTLDDITLSNGSTATVANGVTLNAPTAGQTVKAENIHASYVTAPTGGHINFGTTSGNFQVVNCQTNTGNTFVGNTPSNVSNTAITGSSSVGVLSISNNTTVAGANSSDLQVVETAAASRAFGVRVAGDTEMRYYLTAQGAASYGAGTSVDFQLLRAAAGVLAASKSFLIGSAADLGDNGVGELKLANATTVPTTNPTGGGLASARNGAPWYRDPNGIVSTMISPSEFSTSPTGCLAETFPRSHGSAATVAQAIGGTTGTVYMMAVWLPAGLTITNLSWITGSTAAGTPTHWWLGIANSAGLQQAATADQLTGAITASTLITKALTATYTTPATGLYYLLLSVTATTNPTATGLPVPIPNMNLTAPLLAGVSATTQAAPGTNGTTSYTAPAAAGGIPYMYLT
jgi:hypothetical protein